VGFLLDSSHDESGSNVPDARLTANTYYQFDDSILCDESTGHQAIDQASTSASSSGSDNNYNVDMTRQHFADVLLMESRQAMQDMFIQKFWQLKMVTTVCHTPYHCHEALLNSPARYGIVLLSLRDLVAHGLQDSLHHTIPLEVDRSHCSVVVHGGSSDEIADADMLVLQKFGVDGILSEPFSLKALKVSC